MANTTPVARVSAIQGQAFVKGKDGELRALRVGDPVFEGDVVVTADGSRVDLASADGRTLVVRANETLSVDAEVAGSVKPDAADSSIQVAGADINKVIKAINQGGSLDELLEETAAGESAGGADGGPTFVRLLRIAEEVSASNFEFDSARSTAIDENLVGGGNPAFITAGIASTGLGAVSSPVGSGSNQSPTAIASTSSGYEDTPIAVALAGTDPDGTVTFVTVTTLPTVTQGVLFLSDGTTAVLAGTPITAAEAATLVFKPADNFSGDVSLSFTVTDNEGNTSSAADEVITVGAVNDAPVANPDTLTAVEDTPVTYTAAQLLGNDSDPEGSPLSIASVTSGSHGTAVLNPDGTITFNPAANYNGPADFTYTVSDGSLTSAPATVTVNVGAVNDAPVANPDTLTAVEDTQVTYTALQLLGNDNDPEGSPLSIASVTSGSHGTAVLNPDGTVTFNPAANYNGPADFTYTVSDGSLTSAPATVTVNVGAVNDAPTLDLDANNSHNIVSVQTIAGLFNTGVDASGMPLAIGIADPHYAVIAQPAGGTVTNVPASNANWVANDADSSWIGIGTGYPPTGLYQYQTSFSLPTGADPKSVHIELDIASDNYLRDVLVNGVSTGISVALGYRALDHIALDGGTAAFQPGVNTITFVVENRDPGYPVSSGPTGLRVDNLTSSVAVIGSDVVGHQADYAAIYVEGTPVAISDADVKILDVDNTSVQGATITLTNAQAGDVLLAAGMPHGITATLSSGNTVVTLSGSASLTAYETAIRTIQFSNTSESPSTAVDRTITVVVNDGSASSNVGTTTIHVVAVNDAPTLDLDGNNSAATGTAYATSYTENAAGVSIADSDALITDVDSANIRSATIRLVNAQAGDQLVAGGLPTGIVASSFDPVAGIITLSGNAPLATFQTALRAVTFSSTSDDPGSSARYVEVTVNDGSSNSSTATASVVVNAVNDAAVISAPMLSITETDAVLTTGGTLVITDVDSPATFVPQTNAAGSNGYGHFNLASNGVWTYTTDTAHNEFAAGTTYTDKLTVSSADGTTSTITVNIVGTNDAPLAVDDIVITNIAPGQAISIPSSALLFNDSDPDNGASLSLTAVSNALNGSVLGTNPVVFTNTSLFGASAKIVAEAPLYPGDSETNGLNNTRALAYEIGRGQFGQINAADAPDVGDATLPSFKWTGRIEDVSGTPATTDQDFLKVYLYAGEKITLDIDGADSGQTTIGSDPNAVDMLLRLYDANGVELAQNDDALKTQGGLGSVKSGYHNNSLDSYLQYTVAADGYYYIDATAFNNNANGIIQDSGNYQLWVSIQPTAATHPSSFDYTLSDGSASDSGHVTVTTVQGALISGGNANEILIGGSGNDTLNGGSGKDNLIGGPGNDVLIGGAGNDTMKGDLGADVFQWHFADRGATGAPAIDTLTDFSLAPSASGGDILDLRDLLQGESHAGVAAGNLANYLHFDVAGGGTTVQISSNGGFDSGYNATVVDQQIVLAGVDLSAGGLTSDQLIIQDLLTKGKLVTD